MSGKIIYPAAHAIVRKGILWMARGITTRGKARRFVQKNPAQKKGKVMETQNDKPMFKQIAMLLIQADKLVKEGKLSAALEKIAEARTHDPAHLYAIAYEERVKALLHSRQKAVVSGATRHEISAHTSVAQSTNGHSNRAHITKDHSTPPQPQVSVPSSAEPPKPMFVESEQKGAPPVEQPAAQNLEKNIAGILSQAYHFFLRKEYNHALDEVARIYLLAPSHERARSLEATIRAAIRGQNAAQSIQKNETLLAPKAEKKVERASADHLRRTAITQKVGEIIARIAMLTGQKQFKRALDELTRGYILDPYHPQLRMLEEKIRDEEQRYTRHQNNVANTPVDSVPVKESGGISDRTWKASQCFMRVNDLLRCNKLEDALNELALAVIIDPFNEEAIKLEKTIIEAQHRQLEERRKTCKEIAAMIAA